MKKLILISIFISLAIFIYGGNISEKVAKKVAKNYYFQAIKSIDHKKDIKFESINMSCIKNPSLDETCSLYIYNINNDEGFIIISSDDNIKPVLAYSFETGFNIGNVSPAQKYMLDYYSYMNFEARKNKLLVSNDVRSEWEELIKYNPNQNLKTKSTVTGLLEPIEWNQSSPYNSMCPEASGSYEGYGGRCPVGCSAIAMLQIMKYYNWPSTGTGSYTHYSWENGGFDDFTVNFGQNTYDWYSVPNIGQHQNDELAKICFQAGVAVKMQWSPEGSGAWPGDVASAMVNYFSYEDNIDYIYKNDYSEEDWKSILRSQIDDSKPIFYAGYSDEAGHAWNCDGYQDNDYFHMNWGWGGFGNGFYTLDALGTSATPGSGEGNYSQNQQALINIYPEGPYPTYCNNLVTISGTYGSFDDGSSYENYQNNSSCTYVIEPDCRQIIMLEFTKFNLAAGDYINIWDGSPEENNLLVNLDNTNLPSSDSYEALSGKITIEFNSDADLTDEGWAVDFRTKNCVANKAFTESSGSFDDGSKDCQYEGATLCTWNIQPNNSNQISLDFEYFNLAEGLDFVNIYKKSVRSDNLIATFNHENVPTEILTIDTDTAIIRFFAASNSSRDEGWKINYSSSFNGIINDIISENMTISPNPGNNESKLVIKSDMNTATEIVIYNILGKIIGKQCVELNKGENIIPISSIEELKNDGIYILKIKSNNIYHTVPFVFSE